MESVDCRRKSFGGQLSRLLRYVIQYLNFSLYLNLTNILKIGFKKDFHEPYFNAVIITAKIEIILIPSITIYDPQCGILTDDELHTG